MTEMENIISQQITKITSLDATVGLINKRVESCEESQSQMKNDLAANRRQCEGFEKTINQQGEEINSLNKSVEVLKLFAFEAFNQQSSWTEMY